MTQPNTPQDPQPEALRLAAWLNEGAWHQMRLGDVEAAGRELRRLHAKNSDLRAQLEAIGAGGVSALMVSKAEPMTRFCPGCGSVGPVSEEFRDCCPDGMRARVIPAKLADQCHDLFQLALAGAAPIAATKDVSELLERMRGFEADHVPDGWPAIRMRDVSALCDAVTAISQNRDGLATLLNEALIAFDPQNPARQPHLWIERVRAQLNKQPQTAQQGAGQP